MSEGLQSIWQDACRSLQERLGEDSFERWFSNTRLVESGEEKVILEVPDHFHQWWIESNFNEDLKKVIGGISGRRKEVCFRVHSGDGQGDVVEGVGGAVLAGGSSYSVRQAAAVLEPGGVLAQPALAGSPVALEEGGVALAGVAAGEGEVASDELISKRAAEAGLRPEYTFGSFVIGPNNRFAHAACLAVGKAPSRSYNPLFIHGMVGLGKTHLMQAIGHKLVRSRRRVRVVYLTMEKFTNEFIDAIQRNALTTFRDRYRRADVLMIDDVQFLAGNKERSQEEFFHTFNTLFDNQKQIIMTSDRPASEIQRLEPRLISRFEWGLTAEMQPPDIETRIAILRKKANQWGVAVEDSVINFLATRIRNNVRRLEGGLMRLASYASLSGETVTAELCERLLRDFLQEEGRKLVTIDAIQKKVAEHFDVRLADMTSKRRPANIAFPRQVAMYLSRLMTGVSLADIGDAFGGRDHGTVIHACKRVEAKSRDDEQLRLTLSRLDDELRR